METVRNDPVCFPNREDVSAGLALNPCTFEDRENNWEDLERFWGDESQRVHQLESQLSSSPEKHLLRDDCLKPPHENWENLLKDENSCDFVTRCVRGEDINDIQTSYVLEGFDSHELIAIGTYVDKHITPGFKYRVRHNASNKYFFGGNAQYLEQIGLGYGKRLTFASKCLNKNENYFWSDSSPDGFGFSIEAVSLADQFSVVNCVTEAKVGHLVVTDISNQYEISSNVKNCGSIEKEVKVIFTCDAKVEKKSVVYSNQMTISGTAVLVKEKHSRFAEVKLVRLDSFVLKDCELLPADM